ncbi:MAG: [protein-PII] uridylyltransferase [Pseudomonadota bacterium]|nr:[protein-PII] uridylyltransferase [Pseudomonadota bacterium]
MVVIAKPREIIDRKSLLSKLDELTSCSGYTEKIQNQVLDVFKTAYSIGWSEIRRRFENEKVSSREIVKANSHLVDQLIRTIYDFAITSVCPQSHLAKGEVISIVATGGYGRRELAPFSDIDLMFLLPNKLTTQSEQLVEYILYTLWDLGLVVGHATRTIDEAVRLSRDDLTIRTSLLDSRWLWGDQRVFENFKKRFQEAFDRSTALEFVEAKLAERDARHKYMGDTRYVLEPNIKEGKGGLRDLQTLFWIAKYLYCVDDLRDLLELGVLTDKDVRLFTRAENFFWGVRCHLHYNSNRAEERLTFNVQSEISRCLNYADRSGAQGVERFMKHYFLITKDIGDLTRILCAVFEDQQKKKEQWSFLPKFFLKKRQIEGFIVEGKRLTVPNNEVFKKEPIKLLELFRVAQRYNVDIHPNTLRWVTENLKCIDSDFLCDPQANKLFLEMLLGEKPEITLTRLNEAGVLGRFMPDFGKIVAQMQYDMYHAYTVDEHTIRAIGILKKIEDGRLKSEHPTACLIIGEVQSLRVLYLSVFLHDTAKGRSGDHSVLGAEIANRLGPRLGLSDWETETVSWLVRHHLLLSSIAFKRDIYDPKTSSDLAAIIQSPERLRLLLILTTVDIRAVGPNIWNAWKAGLLRELYYRVQENLVGAVQSGRQVDRVEQVKEELSHYLEKWAVGDREQFFSLGHNDYWLSFDIDTLVHHANLIKEAEKSGHKLTISSRVEEEIDATEIIIYAPDHPGLFAAIAGAMALAGASVVNAKVMTMSNGMAFDVFRIQDSFGNAFSSADRLVRLKKCIQKSLSGRLQSARELTEAQKFSNQSHIKNFSIPTRVLIDNKASTRQTVIEINGRDRLGLLHDLTAFLTESSLQISSAHISTYGARVVDVFYVRDIFGLKLDNEEKLDFLHNGLLKTVSSDVGIKAA